MRHWAGSCEETNELKKRWKVKKLQKDWWRKKAGGLLVNKIPPQTSSVGPPPRSHWPTVTEQHASVTQPVARELLKRFKPLLCGWLSLKRCGESDESIQELFFLLQSRNTICTSGPAVFCFTPTPKKKKREMSDFFISSRVCNGH